MSFIEERGSKIRDLTLDVFPAASALGVAMIDDIVFDNFDEARAEATKSDPRLSSLVADLVVWVPIISGVVDIIISLDQQRRERGAISPDSFDIIKMYNAIYGHVTDEKRAFFEGVTEIARYYLIGFRH